MPFLTYQAQEKGFIYLRKYFIFVWITKNNMKHLVSFFVLISSFVSGNNSDSVKNKITHPLSFTENKGQVCDQNYIPRPDVLFSGSDNNLTYHIKNNGISYQLSKIESWKNGKKKSKPNTINETKIPDKASVYRVDIKWLNVNLHPQIQTDDELPGYDNYYMQQCPKGVLNVKSYAGITLKKLYPGIDLHYYEKEGSLKYDFVVSPNSDYKKIKLSVSGAEISLQTDGSLLLKTPFGDIQEGKPVAFQNGKELKANWKIEGTTLSFDVKDVDPSSELIIDPPIRIWGTYYGGYHEEYAYGSATDNSGNIYIGGSSGTAGFSLVIATTGSHQSLLSGNPDGFIAKFNPAGIRQWGTYYGGAGLTIIKSIDTDNSGNVYAAGYTDMNAGPAMATPGAFQTTYGGGLKDGFIVKFNSAGVRQWGTYYGSPGNDYIMSCSVESSGDVYVSGCVSSSGNFFATAGAYQGSQSGDLDAFLTKFSSSGNRIWSTYYGGSAEDQSLSCAKDNKGNVYLSGYTDNGTAAFTTAGAHQVGFGGIRDAFLIKFDALGARLWGTFYGGTGPDQATSCTADTTGNIFLIGHTTGSASSVIATPGSHQTTSGGNTDAFCVKFNSSGVRQWGTFYGGSFNDMGTGSATDVAGNIYLCGQALSPNTIATPGAHQTALGGVIGIYDGFVTLLNGSGVRQWGSYYGGDNTDIAYDCSVDALNNVYVTGMTLSTFSISTPGSHQLAYSNVDDAFLVKFDGCGAPAAAGSISGTATFCGFPGTPQTYSIAPVSGALSYVWSFPSGWSGSSTTNSITLNTINSGNYISVLGTNTCGVGPASSMYIQINPKPVVSAASGTICIGASFTIAPTGASTYTFSSGSAVVSPTVTTTYSVTGTNGFGCVSSNTATPTITVMPLPSLTLTASSATVCSNTSVTVTASGAYTYTFYPGGGGPTHVYYPTSNTTMTVVGSHGVNCNDTKTISVAVNPLPVINASVSTGSICAGQVATITASGSSSGYTLNPGGTTGSTQTVSPSASTAYYVVGTSSLGCLGSYNVNVAVNPTPTVSVASSNSLLCIGQTATLHATGAYTYTWNTSSTSNSVIVTPTANTTYSVTGTNSSGCSFLCAFTQSVSSCLGLEDISNNSFNISIFPNPTSSEVTITTDLIEENMSAEIMNPLGQVIRKEILLNYETKINLKDQANGIYFIKVIVDNKYVFTKKIIKT